MAPAAATTMSAATLEEVGLKKNTSKTKEMEWVWKVWVLWCMRSLLFVANAVSAAAATVDAVATTVYVFFFSLISILRNIYRLYVYINRIDCCMFNPL